MQALRDLLHVVDALHHINLRAALERQQPSELTMPGCWGCGPVPFADVHTASMCHGSMHRLRLRPGATHPTPTPLKCSEPWPVLCRNRTSPLAAHTPYLSSVGNIQNAGCKGGGWGAAEMSEG